MKIVGVYNLNLPWGLNAVKLNIGLSTLWGGCLVEWWTDQNFENHISSHHFPHD